MIFARVPAGTGDNPVPGSAGAISIRALPQQQATHAMTTKPIKPSTTVRRDDRTSRTDDEHVVDMVLLPPPEHLIRFFPVQDTPVEALVASTRSRIRSILKGEDDRLLVVVGPCSIHDPAAALDYARRLAVERERAADTLEIVMRVYFEKPRTTVGWKGLINDPWLDESCRISEGLRIARQLLIDIGRLGVPSGSELLDTISPQYIGDLIAWGAIGARTTESQVHRELASGSSAPIGFKNGTDGNVKIACDAIQTASRPHHFLGVHKSGQVAMIHTRGNKDCHIILRGGSAPNYDEASVTAACAALGEAGLPAMLMIDCSHANCGKRHERQLEVVHEIARQVGGGSHRVFGAMIESHLHPGAQKFTPGRDDPARLAYGTSITDPCLGWEQTVDALRSLSKAVRRRRKA